MASWIVCTQYQPSISLPKLCIPTSSGTSLTVFPLLLFPVGLNGFSDSTLGVVFPLRSPAFDVTSTVALFSHRASSSSFLATPSPPTSGRFAGTFTELLDLDRPKCMRSAKLVCSGPGLVGDALLCLLSLPTKPRGSGERSGPRGRVGSPGWLGGSKVSCVCVVVRINVNSGTSGERVGGFSDAPDAPSSFILCFLCRRSLSVMVDRSGRAVAIDAVARVAADDLSTTMDGCDDCNVCALVNSQCGLISPQALCENITAHCLPGTGPNSRAALRWDRASAKHSRTSASTLGEPHVRALSRLTTNGQV
jgi:hypothetical protein